METNNSKKIQKVDVNKRPAIYKLLCANYNKDNSKIGIYLLDYSAVLENGHLDQPAIRNFWVSVEEMPLSVELTKASIYTDIACIVSGNEDFMKLHKLLTKEEYNAILAMF